MKDKPFPTFDGKTMPYERWWANSTALLSRTVSQTTIGQPVTAYPYRVEVYVEFLDNGRTYRNMVKAWVTDPITREMVDAASDNFILLTQMEDPEPWNLKPRESKS
jgi:hypothetical protein